MKQRAFKEQVFKLLFRADFNTKEELLEQVPIYFESGDLTVVPEDRARIEERLRAILDRLPEIDQQIAGRLKNWRPERIGKVERTVLRMTVYELQTDTGTPTAVVINDAIELARKFGQDGAGQFVNGVLAAFVPSNNKPGTDKADTAKLILKNLKLKNLKLKNPKNPEADKMRNVYSVSRINAYIRRMFSEDYLLRNVLVRGEVSNCKYHASGHIYFTLKDASGTLSCVMFAGRRRGLSFPMQNGDQVIAEGTVDVYERAGSYQLYVVRIVRDGVGELAEKFELLKKKLLEQGMFDESYKQPVPRYIRTLGVVTASTGAAVRDIIQISKRRNPYIRIILYPAIVQGDAAPDSIVRGIRTLDRLGVDVIIIGRGGGSLEDLWAFNEERVAEAVFECMTPIISAVGHETDTVITDFVADLRAPTPSAAAELAVFDYRRFQDDLDAYRKSLDDAFAQAVLARRNSLRQAERSLRHLSPDARIRDQRMRTDRAFEQIDRLMQDRIDSLRREAMQKDRLDLLINGALQAAKRQVPDRTDLDRLMEIRLSDKRHSLELLAGSLAHLSPLARLSGGYGFVSEPGGKAVRSAGQLRPGDRFCVRFRDGSVDGSVDAVHPLIIL